MLNGTVQWRIAPRVLRVYEAFEAHEVAYAELAAKHGGMVHGSSSLGVHRVNVKSLLNEVCQADRLITLRRHMKYVHPTFVLLVHVGTILYQQARE